MRAGASGKSSRLSSSSTTSTGSRFRAIPPDFSLSFETREWSRKRELPEDGRTDLEREHLVLGARRAHLSLQPRLRLLLQRPRPPGKTDDARRLPAILLGSRLAFMPSPDAQRRGAPRPPPVLRDRGQRPGPRVRPPHQVERPLASRPDVSAPQKKS